MARTLPISAEQPPDATRTAAGQLVTPEYDGLPVPRTAPGRASRRRKVTVIIIPSRLSFGRPCGRSCLDQRRCTLSPLVRRGVLRRTSARQRRHSP